MKYMEKINVVYVSSVTSEDTMNRIIDNSKSKPLQSIQKFHRLICEGIANNGDNVEAITAIPMSRSISKKTFWGLKKEKVNGVMYKYLPFINIPILRQVCLLFFTFIFVVKNCLENKNKIFICDVLNTTISTTTLLITKILRKKCIGIVTDLPRDIGSNKSVSKKINEFYQNKYDGYIILTEEMNNIINVKKKPSIVIEGLVDSKEISDNSIIKKYDKKVIMYAGGLYEKYGVKTMIKAFTEISDKNMELHLYGTGDLDEYIKSIKDERIKFLGVVQNKIIVQEEKKATILINPRFSEAEYTKYSFPSKNMEYMVSGTPIITTKLPGMPKEYYDYIYLIEDESESGMRNSMITVLKLPREELTEKGKKARDFVLKYKNNNVQAKRIIDLCAKLIGGRKIGKNERRYKQN